MMKTREMIRARRRRVVAGVIALVAMAVFPDVAHACPVCFDRDDEARIAFLATTGLLPGLPLGVGAGTGWWLRKRVREVEAKADRQEARGR